MDPTFPLDHPPDYISVPEDLRARPLASFAVPGWLRGLFDSAQLRTLADLHGKRISDFSGYRSCGKVTKGQLRDFVRSLQSPTLDGAARFPMLMSEYRQYKRDMPPRPILVPAGIRSLKVGNLPMSVRLEGVLRRMGVARLGDLEGKGDVEVLGQWGCGRKTFNELDRLLSRAGAGEFRFPAGALEKLTPLDLLRQIDELVEQLPATERILLVLRYGSDGQPPLSFRKIGKRCGCTGQFVQVRLVKALNVLRRNGSVKLTVLLRQFAKRREAQAQPLSSEEVRSWVENNPPPRHPADFYFRLITRLLRTPRY